jgi:soluble lytic murein transglycosylase-like protein
VWALACVAAVTLAAAVAVALALAAADAGTAPPSAREIRVALGSPAAVVPAGCPIPARFRTGFAEASRKTGVPLSLLVAVAMEESAMRSRAVSHAGAIGLMQVMPGTARELGLDPRRPATNVLAGARYLVRLLERFGGDLGLALAAYNAGPGAVERADGAPSEAVLRYAASVQARAASLPACDSV